MKILSARPSSLFFAVTFVACGAMPAAAQDAASLNPLTRLDKATLKDFLERPLFDPSRRRPPEAVAPVSVMRAPVLDEPPPSLHLLGVIRGVRDIAIVRRAGEQKTIALGSGERIGDWIATVVPPISLRLHKGERAFEYALFTTFNKSAAPVALAAPTGPVDAVGMPLVMPSSWGQLAPR